jgi:hypothetical protein
MAIYVYNGSIPVPDPNGEYTITKNYIPFRSVKSPRLMPVRYVRPANNFTTPVRQVKPLLTIRYRNTPMLPESQGTAIGFSGNKQYEENLPMKIYSGQSMFAPGLRSEQGLAGFGDNCAACCKDCVDTCLESGRHGGNRDECRKECGGKNFCPGCSCERSHCRGRACDRGLSGIGAVLRTYLSGGRTFGPLSSAAQNTPPGESLPGTSVLDFFTGYSDKNYEASLITIPGSSVMDLFGPLENFPAYIANMFTTTGSNEVPGPAAPKQCSNSFLYKNDSSGKCAPNWMVLALIGLGAMALLGSGGGHGSTIVKL